MLDGKVKDKQSFWHKRFPEVVHGVIDLISNSAHQDHKAMLIAHTDLIKIQNTFQPGQKIMKQKTNKKL